MTVLMGKCENEDRFIHVMQLILQDMSIYNSYFLFTLLMFWSLWFGQSCLLILTKCRTHLLIKSKCM